MKRLRPQEIIETNNYVGFKPRQIRAMAEHYGFIRTNDGDAKHLKFTHRDYHDLAFTMQANMGDVGQMYVQDVVEGCMEVKRRNAKRKEPVFQKVPEWVWKALPEGSFVMKADQSVVYEMDDREERQYKLEMRGNKLSVRSLDYPLEEFSISYTVRDGSAHIMALQKMFEPLDAQVRTHTQDVTAQFHNGLDRLKGNHGYCATKTHGHAGEPHLLLTHPVYDTKLDIRLPNEGRTMPDESLEKLRALLEQSRESCMSQMELLEELNRKGWHVKQHAANGAAAALQLSGPNGEQVEVPTYGLHAVFDAALLQEKLRSAPKPEAVLPVETGPSVVEQTPAATPQALEKPPIISAKPDAEAPRGTLTLAGPREMASDTMHSEPREREAAVTTTSVAPPVTASEPTASTGQPMEERAEEAAPQRKAAPKMVIQLPAMVPVLPRPPVQPQVTAPEHSLAAKVTKASLLGTVAQNPLLNR